jgi:hypothetical protein
MRRRKNRERRHVWLQRELEASGYPLNECQVREAELPPSITHFDTIAVRRTASPDRHRPAAREVSAFN